MARSMPMEVTSRSLPTSIATITNLDSLEVSCRVSHSFFGIQFRTRFALVDRPLFLDKSPKAGIHLNPYGRILGTIFPSRLDFYRPIANLTQFYGLDRNYF